MALDIKYSCPIIRFLNISSKYDEEIYLFQSVLSCLCLIKFLFLAFFYGSLVTVRGTGSKKISQ